MYIQNDIDAIKRWTWSNTKYYQFYDNSYSEYYKIYFCNKDFVINLEKIYFLFYTSYLGTKKIGTYRAGKFKWMTHSVFSATNRWHIQSFLQMHFFFCRISTILVQRIENFMTNLDCRTLKTVQRSEQIKFRKWFEVKEDTSLSYKIRCLPLTRLPIRSPHLCYNSIYLMSQN